LFPALGRRHGKLWNDVAVQLTQETHETLCAYDLGCINGETGIPVWDMEQRIAEKPELLFINAARLESPRSRRQGQWVVMKFNLRIRS
jgi:hypothetical protein